MHRRFDQKLLLNRMNALKTSKTAPLSLYVYFVDFSDFLNVSYTTLFEIHVVVHCESKYSSIKLQY